LKTTVDAPRRDATRVDVDDGADVGSRSVEAVRSPSNIA
jgi:hypothetical protein